MAAHAVLWFKSHWRAAIPFLDTVDVGPAGLGEHVVRVPAFGRVAGRLSQPLAGASVSLTGAAGDRAETKVNSDGAFSFDGVAPGIVRLMASLQGRYYVRRVRGDGWEAARVRWAHEFLAPESGASITVEVSDESGAVTGRVVDEQDRPLPNARVHFGGGAAITMAAMLMSTLTDQDGNFRIQGLAPGRHEIFVCKDRPLQVDVAANAADSVTLRDCPLLLRGGELGE